MSTLLSSMITTTALSFNKGKWSLAEDDLLRSFVAKFGEKKWKKISDLMLTRSPLQCLHRWTKILKPGMIKGPWTLEEDQKLSHWVRSYGANKWSMAAKMIPGRNGKQCRERWINHLNPEIKKGNWTEAEDEKIYQLYQKYGSAWSKIARHFAGRSENSIKNRFYATLRKFDHMKRRTEILSLNLIKNEENLTSSISGCNTAENTPEKVDVKEENVIESFFNEQIFENNWNLEEFEEMSSQHKESLSTNSCCSDEKKENMLNQNNVMEILNDIMEDDNRLDEKILNMIDSLKTIELEIMGKIAKTMKEENSKPVDLRRNIESLDFDGLEDLEPMILKKIRLV